MLHKGATVVAGGACLGASLTSRSMSCVLSRISYLGTAEARIAFVGGAQSAAGDQGGWASRKHPSAHASPTACLMMFWDAMLSVLGARNTIGSRLCRTLSAF